MNILCIGDIVGEVGRTMVREWVPVLKEELSISLVVANVENAAGGSGITPKLADKLFRYGCDVLTTGDHIWDRQEIVDYLGSKDCVIRPLNFPQGTPGRGFCVIELPGGIKVGIINLLGRVFIRYQSDCPFRAAEKAVAEISRETKNIVVDFHAETTSEKMAMGMFLDGKVSAVVGSHTHIQTADDRILPQGTAYLTDLGMTGPYDSVIGQDKEKIIKRFLSCMPSRFEVAKGDPWLCGAVIDIDESTGLARSIQRIKKFAREG